MCSLLVLFLGVCDMAIELCRLIKKVQHTDITLLAGQEGIHNLVNWVHMVETSEASDFLDGGEIVFITGLGLTDEYTLLHLVQSINQKRASGVIVNTGPFIEEIPQDVIDFCNQVSLPLYVVPWKIHLAEIMRIFCFAITKDEQEHLATAAAFKNAICYPNQQELYTIALSQHHFQANWRYAAGILKLNSPQEHIHSRIEMITISLQNYIAHNYHNCAIFTNDTEIIFVVANYTKEELYQLASNLKSHAQQSLLRTETLTMGVGRLTQSIRCLHKSYHQAQAIERLQANEKIPDTMFFYSDMGIYRLLIGIEDKDIVTDYIDNTIQPLLDYDASNHSDLVLILKSYLNHNGSVKETAEELFVHRNTVNYKLSKISDILQMDLSSLDTRVQLMISFMLQDTL
jgi:hypothetical protein